MKCEIIKDLLPGYIDEILSDESKAEVEEHIAECDNCKYFLDNMKDEKSETEINDKKLLRGINKKLNKKNKITIISSVIAVTLLVGAYFTLFELPLKAVSPKEVSLTVEENELGTLAKKSNKDNADISIDSDDDVYEVVLPNNSYTFTVGEKIIERDKVATLITYKSKYFLREILINRKGDTIYITGFKTTFLNNKIEERLSSSTMIEFGEINRIVFVQNNKETILWKK